MLTSRELSEMRSVIGNLLPDTCNILSVTYVSDGMGGETQTWGTAGTSACRLDMRVNTIAGREMEVGAAWQSFASYILSIPYDTSISTENRVEHSGTTYAVKSASNGQSWSAVKRIELEKV